MVVIYLLRYNLIIKMTNVNDKWRFGYILPNLSIKRAIDSQYVAIAPINDPRVQDIVNTHPIIKNLTNGFSDQFNRKVSPSLLIYNDSIPVKSLRNGALIDFRNLIAICCIVNAWQAYLLRGQWFILGQYSEYFSLYPVVPHNSNKYLVTLSPAVRGIDIPDEFSGQTIPELGGPAYEIEHDPYI